MTKQEMLSQVTLDKLHRSGLLSTRSAGLTRMRSVVANQAKMGQVVQHDPARVEVDVRTGKVIVEETLARDEVWLTAPDSAFRC